MKKKNKSKTKQNKTKQNKTKLKKIKKKTNTFNTLNYSHMKRQNPENPGVVDFHDNSFGAKMALKKSENTSTLTTKHVPLKASYDP